jgi:hypothetical protein
LLILSLLLVGTKALGKLTSLVEEVKEAEVAFTIITIASLATSRRSGAFHFPG